MEKKKSHISQKNPINPKKTYKSEKNYGLSPRNELYIIRNAHSPERAKPNLYYVICIMFERIMVLLSLCYVHSPQNDEFLSYFHSFIYIYIYVKTIFYDYIILRLLYTITYFNNSLQHRHRSNGRLSILAFVHYALHACSHRIGDFRRYMWRTPILHRMRLWHQVL